MSDIITSALFRNAETTPGKAAFIDASDGRILTHGEFCVLALRFAAAIKASGADAESPVVITVSRAPECVAAEMAALMLNRWYVPLDSELTAERTALLLSVAKPSLIIDVAGTGASYENVPVIKTDALPAPLGKDEIHGHDDDTALFGIFTSGSTGLPKLVVKPFSAMAGFAEIYCRTFGFTADEVFGNQIPFYFDASTKDVFATVLLGASCVIIPAQTFSFPVNLVKTLNDYKITTIVWVPSAIGIAAKFNVFSVALPEYLKNVLFVGERMPVKYLNVWINSLPGVRFVNLYGSTEVAGNSCYYVIDRAFGDSDVLPIGRPFEGTEVFILDPETRAPATEGEICVAGPGLAIGYYGDAEKTAAAFREMKVGEFEGRLYFSGDFGRINDVGELVCVSRRDSQIKHMGHRIELGEIETNAAALSFVDEACCFYDAEKEKIVLFYSAQTDVKAEVRRALADVLPKYMLPHKYIYKNALPHNRNGKIDRALLKSEI